MTRSAQAAFGAVRQADQHELETWEIAVRARLSKAQACAAVRDLCALGVLVRRREGRTCWFRINHKGGDEDGGMSDRAEVTDSGDRSGLCWADVAEAASGTTIEVHVFDRQHGWEWERRQVVAVDWPEITLLDGDRRYTIDAVLDSDRRLRDPDEKPAPQGQDELSADADLGRWKPDDAPSPFFVRHADALYEACAEAIRSGRIDARSRIGDAALDYRDERDEMARRAARGLPLAPTSVRPEGSE